MIGVQSSLYRSIQFGELNTALLTPKGEVDVMDPETEKLFLDGAIKTMRWASMAIVAVVSGYQIEGKPAERLERIARVLGGQADAISLAIPDDSPPPVNAPKLPT